MTQIIIFINIKKFLPKGDFAITASLSSQGSLTPMEFSATTLTK